MENVVTLDTAERCMCGKYFLLKPIALSIIFLFMVCRKKTPKNMEESNCVWCSNMQWFSLQKTKMVDLFASASSISRTKQTNRFCFFKLHSCGPLPGLHWGTFSVQNLWKNRLICDWPVLCLSLKLEVSCISKWDFLGDTWELHVHKEAFLLLKAVAAHSSSRLWNPINYTPQFILQQHLQKRLLWCKGEQFVS